MDIRHDCELCTPDLVSTGNALAYVRLDDFSPNPGHVIVVPKRHVADFSEMTYEEQAAVLEVLLDAHRSIGARRVLAWKRAP